MTGFSGGLEYSVTLTCPCGALMCQVHCWFLAYRPLLIFVSELCSPWRPTGDLEGSNSKNEKSNLINDDQIGGPKNSKFSMRSERSQNTDPSKLSDTSRKEPHGIRLPELPATDTCYRHIFKGLHSTVQAQMILSAELSRIVDQ